MFLHSSSSKNGDIVRSSTCPTTQFFRQLPDRLSFSKMTKRLPNREDWKRPIPCNTCKTSRKKCTLEQPACSRCSKLGLTCVYAPEFTLVKRRKGYVRETASEEAEKGTVNGTGGAKLESGSIASCSPSLQRPLLPSISSLLPPPPPPLQPVVGPHQLHYQQAPPFGPASHLFHRPHHHFTPQPQHQYQYNYDQQHPHYQRPLYPPTQIHTPPIPPPQTHQQQQQHHYVQPIEQQDLYHHYHHPQPPPPHHFHHDSHYQNRSRMEAIVSAFDVGLTRDNEPFS
ncbi:hypothetical protein BCR33DRAFT_328020 [Rhizoclosmatium globosum]|uniref:Zn(2)-C6 fungal-type domain-containing protein n=1 Tax=Rhizoclosmatium globosum TaxID=329046 RepID=A0A1Y2C4U1_9FUNG|nr:hypothetical protein BCR33DRAFT_328020 [Rhizoclosmatium globosum]|eukprot:ORY41904.1 hypothetical protein BCR33DRAFT_328020 [Rhizoclosmatium globosum]